MWALVHLQIRNHFNLSALAWSAKNDRKKFFATLGIVALVVLSFSPLYVGYIRLQLESLPMYAAAGLASMLLASAILLASLMILFFGFIFLLSMFYFSNDLNFLLTLPIKPETIIMSKFAVVLLYEYLFAALILLPSVWIYASHVGVGLLYWPIAFIVLLLLPVLPLVLSSLAVFVLMSVSNISKHKDLMRYLGMFVFLVLILGFNYMATRIPEGNEAEFMEKLLLSEDGMLQFATRIFPPALYAARALSHAPLQALQNLGILVVLNSAALVLLLFIGKGLFFRGLIGSNEMSVSKSLSKDELEKRISVSLTAEWAIAVREIRYLLRTPIYAFNSVAMLLLLPVMLGFAWFSGAGIPIYIDLLRDVLPVSGQIFGTAAVLAGMALLVPAASSSFSREGRLFSISQVIPVSSNRQIHGKILYAMLLSYLILPAVPVLGLFLFHWTVLEHVLALVFSLLAPLPLVLVSLLIDILRPYFHWDSPHKAIKQNWNVVLAMLLGALWIFLNYRFVDFLFRQGISLGIQYWLVLLINLLITSGLYVSLQLCAKKQYSRLMV